MSKSLRFTFVSSAFALISSLVIYFSRLIPNQFKWVVLPIFLLEMVKYAFILNGRRFNRKAITLQNIFNILLVFSVFAMDVRFRMLVQNINHSEQNIVIEFVANSETTLNEYSDFEGLRVGLLSDRESLAGYLVPKALLEKSKVEVEYVQFPEYADMITALNKQEIDVAAFPAGYQSMFGSIDELKQPLTKLKTVLQDALSWEVKVTDRNNDVLNIVLIGGDNPIVGKSTAGFNYDVIVVMSVNFKTQQSVMLSIPRDAYIYSSCTQKMDKITHTGWSGAECLTTTLSQFLDVPISSYMMVDFKGLIDVVDSVDGVWIDVETAIEEQDENRSFDQMIRIDPGYQLLDGQHALAFLRHRKSLSGGAITRSENHEKFVVALLNQMLQPSAVLKVPALLNALETSVLTNISTEDIYHYYQKIAEIATTGKVAEAMPKSVSLTGHGEMIYTKSFNAELYYYVLDESSILEVREAFQTNQAN